MSDNSWICEPCGLDTLPAPDGKPVIRLVDLEKTLDGKKVLDGVNLDIPSQRITAIIGLSGAGKSVMLKHMIGLIRPERGQVLVDGVDISRLSRKELYHVRRRFGMLFQGGALFDSLTVYENVAFPLQEKTNLGEGKIRERVLSRLAQVGLEEARGKYPDELSGGMKRRVAFARAMVTDPEIILFDEPTTGLDPMTAATIGHLIRSTQRDMKTTSVVVTHDIPLARLVGDRVAFLEGGRFSFVGSWSDADRSEDPIFSRFLAGLEEEESHVA